MLISTCLSEITNRDYTSQLININHELNGNNDFVVIVENNVTQQFYDDDTIIIIDNPSTNPTNPTNPIPPKPITYNASVSDTVKKDNCPTGFQGTTSQLSVSATSLISQLDANQKAQDLFNQQKQTYINTVGQCICSLEWIYPTVSYKNGKAYVTVVIPGATKYALKDQSYQIDNQFIITEDGEYTIYAANGDCIVNGNVVIKVGIDYGISNITLKRIVCDLNFPDDGNISGIIILQRGCGNTPFESLSNIRIVQSGCKITDRAEIKNIRVVNNC